MFFPFDLIFASLLLGIACNSAIEILAGSIGYSVIIVILALAGFNPYLKARIERNREVGQSLFLSIVRPIIQCSIFIFVCSLIIHLIKGIF